MRRSLLLAAFVSVTAGGALANDSTLFDIPPQPLVKALRQFADQSGLQLAYEASLAAGRTSPSVKGALSARQALEALLKGTDLRFEFIDERTVVLSAIADPRSNNASSHAGVSLTAMLVALMSPFASASSQTVAAADDLTIETVNVFASLDNELSVGSKSGQSLRETPKSVTLVTRERIEAQNLTSLADTLKQTTGVTVTSYTSADNAYFSRGFRVQTIQLDGGAPAISNAFGAYLTPDTAAYDHGRNVARCRRHVHRRGRTWWGDQPGAQASQGYCRSPGERFRGPLECLSWRTGCHRSVDGGWPAAGPPRRRLRES